MEKLFPKVWEVVDKYRQLCNLKSGDYSADIPFVNTEVWNEGWMLRLVVAKLHDMDSVSGCEAAKVICACSKRGWCSEGRLYPLFENEKSTRADGIVGDLTLRPKTKWGFDASPQQEGAQFVVLEAKMNSALSKGVAMAEDFDQASRYVACLSGILSKVEDAQGRIYVIVPKERIGHFRPTVEEAQKRFFKELESKNGDRHKLREGLDVDRIRKAAERIRIDLVTWDDLISVIPTDEGGKDINDFYTQAKGANGVGPC